MSNKMDPRCPRQLKQLPRRFCPLAVQRLKAIRYSDKELTEEEEANLPGCKWAVYDQMSNYCFFSLINDLANRQQLADVEIAHIVGLSGNTIRTIEKQAINKIKNDEAIKEIIEVYGDESILSEHDSQD